MPYFNTRAPGFRKKKELRVEWKNFKDGLNLLLRPTELKRSEMAQADNIVLVGSGVPRGRWGSLTYFEAGATGSVRGFGTYKSGSTNEFLALSDDGYLVKKNNSSYTQINGQSWPSGTTIQTEQLGGNTYISSEDVVFTKYDGSNLSAFVTISPPTGLGVTNFSGASGTNQISYKIVTLGSNGGSTTPSDNYVLGDLPLDLTESQYHLFWTAASAATYSGFEIYRGKPGDETLLASVGPETTTYIDNGTAASPTILAPSTNTTGGLKSKFIVKYKDRLLLVDKDDPTKLVITGRFPNHTKTSWADGGGYVYIDPDSGDDITGIVVQPIADRIVVYKNFSSYLVELQTVSIGNFSVLDPKYQPISTGVGCSNQGTIQTVENDSFYFGRDGLYVTGYEPNFLNIIRTNEVSARVRPYLDTLNETDYTTATALYVDNKYLLSFPAKKEMLVYDRERGCFAGIWKLPFGISHMNKYIDGSGNEHWVLGSYENNQVYEFDINTNSDNGTAIVKTLRTNKDYLDDWTILNILNLFFFLFKSVTGSTTVNIIAEDREGNSTTVKSFTISGSEVAGGTGWGMNQFGTVKWGQTTGSYSTTGNEITRWGTIFKEARIVQLEITSSANNANFELLESKLTAVEQTERSLSSTQKV